MKIQRKDELIHFILIALGSFIMAVSLNAFLLNNNLVIGVGGVSRIIEKWFDIPQNYVYWFLSTLILLLGSMLRKDNNKGDFMFRSFTGIVWVSFVFLPVTKRMSTFRLTLPEPFSFMVMPVTSSVGAILLGLGIGIIMKSGGSTCGLDLLARLFEKEKNIKITSTMRVFDSLLLMIGIVTFFGKDFFHNAMPQSILIYISSSLILIYLLPKAVAFIDDY